MNSDVVRLGKVRKLRKRFTSVLTQLKATLSQLLQIATQRLQGSSVDAKENSRTRLLKSRIQAVDELDATIKSTSLKNDMLVLLLSRKVQQPYAVCEVMVDLGYVEWLQTIQTEDSRQKLDEFILKTCFLARELDTTRQLTESTSATIQAMQNDKQYQRQHGHTSSQNEYDLEKGLPHGRGDSDTKNSKTVFLHTFFQDSIKEVRKSLYFSCESHAEAACALHMNTKDKLKSMKKNLNTTSTAKISKTGQSIIDMANKAIAGKPSIQKLVPSKMVAQTKKGLGQAKINEARVKMLKNVVVKILSEVKSTLPPRDDLEDLLFLTDSYLSDLSHIFDLSEKNDGGSRVHEKQHSTLDDGTVVIVTESAESNEEKLRKLNTLWRGIVKDITMFVTTLAELDSCKNLQEKLFVIVESMGNVFQRSYETARSAFGGSGASGKNASKVPGSQLQKVHNNNNNGGGVGGSFQTASSMFKTVYDACMDAVSMFM